MNYFDKNLPKANTYPRCWYVKDLLFSLHLFYSNLHFHTFRVTLGDNYCKGSWLILKCWRLPNLHFFFSECVWMQCCVTDESRRLGSTEAINGTGTNTQTEGWCVLAKDEDLCFLSTNLQVFVQCQLHSQLSLNPLNPSIHIHAIKNYLREFYNRLRHFPFGDHLINSYDLSPDSVWISLGENWSWSLLGLKG